MPECRSGSKQNTAFLFYHNIICNYVINVVVVSKYSSIQTPLWMGQAADALNIVGSARF